MPSSILILRGDGAPIDAVAMRSWGTAKAPGRSNALYVDAHNHLLMSHAGWDGGQPRVLPCDEICSRLQAGDVGAVGLIVGGKRSFPQLVPKSSWWGTLDALAQFWRGQAAASRALRVIRSAEDVDRISPDAPGVILGIEGTSLLFDTPLEDPSAALHLLVRLGVRSVQWLAALPNAAFGAEANPQAPLRLSAAGRELIAESNRLGLIIDVAHLTGDDPAFQEILDLSTSPPIASHHSCRALNESPRALDDEAIRAIAGAGGVIGVHSGSAYLTASGQQASPGDFLRQICHIVDLAGVDSVAVGTDYIDTARIPIDLPESTFMDGMRGPESLGLLNTRLAEAGFGDGECRKILGENVRRVWRASLRPES